MTNRYVNLKFSMTTPIHIVITADQPGHKINRNIYGHFAEHLGRCIYEGFWVGEDSPIPNTRGIRNDMVEALRALAPPVLRWPGGCFADEYHWKDGIGPREARPSIVNTHWGGVVENNHFGTHEFFDLCELLGAQPYICGNVGSGSPQEMQTWVEYCTHEAGSPMSELRRRNGRQEPWKLPYFGVGNESWGCGGSMTPEYYANEYRRYQTFVKNLGGNVIYKIACGANNNDYHWTEVLMKQAGRHMHGLSLHYYTVPGTWQDKGNALVFDETDWYKTLQSCLGIEELIQRHGTIMDQYDPEKRVGMIIDEWGTWWNVEPGTNPGFLYQQNTQRDALVAALSLNVFNRHGDRVQMTNIAQTVNVLQAMALTDGPRMLLTPTFHVFEMWKVHHDATHLPALCDNYPMVGGDHPVPQVSYSASRDASGKIHLTLANTSADTPATVRLELRGDTLGTPTGRVLAAAELNAHNTFDEPNRLTPRKFTATELFVHSDVVEVTLPPAAVGVVGL